MEAWRLVARAADEQAEPLLRQLRLEVERLRREAEEMEAEPFPLDLDHEN